jgi:hypothetical protein
MEEIRREGQATDKKMLMILSQNNYDALKEKALIERKSITLLVNEIFNQWREKNEK